MTRKALLLGLLALVIILGPAGLNAEEEKTFTVPISGVAVPDTYTPQDRTYVGMGYYTGVGMPAESLSSAIFATYKLLLPGREQIEDPERKILRPHLAELRMVTNKEALLIWDMQLLVVIWDASGSGMAEFLAVSRHSDAEGDMKLIGWTVYALRGKPLPMIEIGLPDFFMLAPKYTKS